MPASILDRGPTTKPSEENRYGLEIEHLCVPVIHLTTGETITQYKLLVKDPARKKGWSTDLRKEFGRLAQGNNRSKTQGTN